MARSFQSRKWENERLSAFNSQTTRSRLWIRVARRYCVPFVRFGIVKYIGLRRCTKKNSIHWRQWLTIAKYQSKIPTWEKFRVWKSDLTQDATAWSAIIAGPAGVLCKSVHTLSSSDTPFIFIHVSRTYYSKLKMTCFSSGRFLKLNRFRLSTTRLGIHIFEKKKLQRGYNIILIKYREHRKYPVSSWVTRWVITRIVRTCSN